MRIAFLLLIINVVLNAGTVIVAVYYAQKFSHHYPILIQIRDLLKEIRDESRANQRRVS